MNSATNNKKPLIAIIGRPNVGKSSLFNRILGERRAIVSDVSGTTRDRVLAEAEWQGSYFWLMDTAGFIVKMDDDELGESIGRQIDFALMESDYLIWLVDGQFGINEEDRQVFRKIKKYLDRVVLVANKVDSEKIEKNFAGWEKLGFKECLLVSAETGRGVGDLLDYIVDAMTKKLFSFSREMAGSDILAVTIMGRTNVGKSSLVNALCGYERMVVSCKPGTTRDAGEVKIKVGQKEMLIYDTAGIRRNSKMMGNKLESYSFIRSLRVLDKSDAVVLILDGFEGVTKRDLYILDTIIESEKSVLLFVNKSDLFESEKTQDEYLEQMRNRMRFAYWVPVVFGSTKTKSNLKILLEQLFHLAKRYNSEFSDEDLKIFLGEMLKVNHRANILGISHIRQIGQKPPKFKIKVKNKKTLCDGDERMLKSILRDYFQLQGIPIRLLIK